MADETASWATLPFLCIDTETTGVNPFTDRIVETCAVILNPDDTQGDIWSTIINPGIDIPDEAAAIHGITTTRAKAEGIPTELALIRLGRHLWHHIETHGGLAAVVMFNARFDWPLILAEAARHHVEIPCSAPILDPYLLDRLCDRYRRGKRQLTMVSDHYGVELGDAAHGAVADATASGRVLRELARRYPKTGEQTLAELWLRQTHGAEVLRRGFVEYKRRTEPGFDSPAGWPIPVEVPRS